MPTIYLVRHTRPAIDAGVCYGAADIPLNAARFAQHLPRIHAQLPLDAQLIASPLSRCAALAQALHTLSPTRTLRFDTRLAEMSFGRWQGLRWDDVERAELDAWAADFMHYAGHGGESPAQVQARVLALWNELSQQASSAVLITHAGPIRVIAAAAKGVALEKFSHEIGYGEVVQIDL